MTGLGMVLYSFIWCFTHCMVFSSTLFNFIRSFLILFFFFWGWSYLDKCRYNKLTNSAFIEFFQDRGSSALWHCWKCKSIPQYRRCGHPSVLGPYCSLELAGRFLSFEDCVIGMKLICRQTSS